MSGSDLSQDGGLYEVRRKIYPRETEGRFQRLRSLAMWGLLGIFYLLPWVPWHGRQAVLFDLPARQFHLFGLTLWPQDFVYLTWLLIIAALSLFFFTALYGRVWCGYACPQTVWTEAFVRIERFCEGDRSKQMKLARAEWGAEKLARRGAKQFLWIAFAVWTGFTFVGYFTPIAELARKLASFSTGPWETFWVLFYGGATYFNAGLMREQVCKYMCPYARFQSAMFDRDTLVVSYDITRGEPRGARKKGSDHKARGLGDCVDCTMCVQVCPTGIDIRKGLQYECIACAACVDACDEVMDKVGYARGLIRYDTQSGLSGGKRHILRPRTIVYGLLLAGLTAGLFWSLSARTPLGVDVLRDRNALYRTLPDGRIENVYNVKILNKDGVAHEYRIEAAGLAGIEADYAGPTVLVEAGSVLGVPVRVRVPAASSSGGSDVEIAVVTTDGNGYRAASRARFLAPVR